MRVIDLMDARQEDICLSRLVLLSGIRPAGRTVDRRAAGRRCHGFLYVWEGQISFALADGSAVRLHAGDLAIVPKGSCYLLRYEAQSTTYVLLDCLLTMGDGEEVSLTEQVTVVANDLSDRRIAGIMAKLEMCGASENSAALFRRKELAYRLLSVIFEDSALGSLRQARSTSILPGVRLLRQSYLESLPIGQLAQVCDMSVSSFRRQFSMAYGMSPVQYRNRLRVNRAQQLLAEGSCTVTEAAYASGFENLGYFSRCYKKLTGETPQATRAAKR